MATTRLKNFLSWKLDTSLTGGSKILIYINGQQCREFKAQIVNVKK